MMQIDSMSAVEDRADVGDAALAYWAGHNGRLAVEPAVGFSVAQQNLGVIRVQWRAARPTARLCLCPNRR